MDREVKWEAAMPEVRWLMAKPEDQWLDGTDWPKEIEVQAWERNDEGERRIKARRTYRLVEGDTR